jgi:hypothetical protein
VRLRRASDFLLNGQEKVTKEKATLLGACRAAPDKSVSRGRAFRQGILPWRKGADIHVDSPAGLSSTTHRLTRGLKIKGDSNGNSNENRGEVDLSTPRKLDPGITRGLRAN